VTGAARGGGAPDVPTLKELGYEGFDGLFVANSLLAPTGTSPAIVEALNREVVRMNASGPIREKLLQASYEPGAMSPAEYGAMIDRELKLWGDVGQEPGVRVKAGPGTHRVFNFAHVLIGKPVPTFPGHALPRRCRSEHSTDQLRSAVQHRPRQPSRVHGARPRRQPRF